VPHLAVMEVIAKKEELRVDTYALIPSVMSSRSNMNS
jgi:hypothetical protein